MEEFSIPLAFGKEKRTCMVHNMLPKYYGTVLKYGKTTLLLVRIQIIRFHRFYYYLLYLLTEGELWHDGKVVVI